MKCTLILADAAQVMGERLYILGGGWTVTGPQMVPMALGMLFEVEWTEANTRYTADIGLVDADGQPVKVPPANQDLKVSLGFEVGRPAGYVSGAPLNVAAAINFAPLPLLPGKSYSWRLEVGGTDMEVVVKPFAVRSPYTTGNIQD